MPAALPILAAGRQDCGFLRAAVCRAVTNAAAWKRRSGMARWCGSASELPNPVPTWAAMSQSTKELPADLAYR